MKNYKFSSFLISLNALVPLVLLGWDAYHHRLGANPLEFITRTTGMLTLIFLVLTLLITPLRKLTKWNWLGRERRQIGLFAFFYGSLHFLTYIWFDKAFNLRLIAQDLTKRYFIIIGMLSFFLMIPLAITSTNAMIRRLGGRRWNLLHKLVYVTAIGGVIHFYLLVKADTTKPLIYAAAFSLLLGYRLLAARFRAASQSKGRNNP